MNGKVSLLSLGLWMGGLSGLVAAQPLEIPFDATDAAPLYHTSAQTSSELSPIAWQETSSNVSTANFSPLTENRGDSRAGLDNAPTPPGSELEQPTGSRVAQAPSSQALAAQAGNPPLERAEPIERSEQTDDFSTEQDFDDLDSASDSANLDDDTAPLSDEATFSALLQSLFDDFSVENAHANLPELDTLDLSTFEVPVELTPEVVRWMEFFSSRGRGIMLDWLARSNRYLPTIQQEFEAAGMPPELAYVAMIESGFVSHSTSGMGAAGMWQFMPRTARAEGLKVERWVDERRDPVKATRAAARHFQSLYNRFDDWYLALAAYNAGAGRVNGALNRYRTNSFWSLARRRALRAETCNYVPRFLAVAIISENPERFGFYNVPYDSSLPYETVQVSESTPLALIAAQLGVPADDVRLLNQELIRGSTPPGTYSIKVPMGSAAIYEAVSSGDASALAKAPTFRQHRVQSGQSLERLARIYGVSVKAIQELNGFRSSRLQIGDLVLIPGDEASPELEQVALRVEAARPASRETGNASASSASQKALARDNSEVAQNQVHRVKPGDTLWSISRRYMVSVPELARYNNLRHPHAPLSVGQRLDIPNR